MDCPKQPNNDDCGVYMLHNFELLVKSGSVEYYSHELMIKKRDVIREVILSEKSVSLSKPADVSNDSPTIEDRPAAAASSSSKKAPPKKNTSSTASIKKKAKTEEGPGGKKSKAKKEGPKKGLSAFMFYSQGARSGVIAENPGIKFGEIGKIVGADWKAMNDDEKQDYVEMERKDKERYETELRQFKQQKAQELEIVISSDED